MLKYLLPILGLATLTALWMAFQLWLKKMDPDRDERCVGCGSNCRREDAEDERAPAGRENSMD